MLSADEENAGQMPQLLPFQNINQVNLTGGSSVARHMPLVLEVPGSIPAWGTFRYPNMLSLVSPPDPKDDALSNVIR